MTATAAPVTPPAPGLARVVQIEGLLLSDETLKGHVGPKDVGIPRRDGSRVLMVHRLSMAVTLRMMKDGKEPLHAKAPEVGNYARIILDEQAEEAVLANSPDAAVVPPDAAPAAEAAPAPAPAAPAPAAPAAAKKPRAKAAPTPAAAPAEASEAPVTDAVAEAPAPAASKRVAPAKKAEASAAPVVATPVATPAPESDDPKINVRLSVYSLIVGAQELAEKDEAPGAQARREKLLAVAKLYRDALTAR